MVNFPTSLDSFIDPVLTDTLASPPHHTQHGDINHAVEALETKLGIDASTPVANSVLTGTGTGHSSFSTDPIIDSLILVEEAAPSVSAAGKARVYADTAHTLFASINGATYKKIIRSGDVFNASGVNHSDGLVPDPGASAGTTKFLREDSSWQPIIFPVANSRTTYAARPAAGNTGRIWQATDSIFEAFDDGVNWKERVFGQDVKSTVAFPSTWVNQGTSTKDTTLGGLILNEPSPAHTDDTRIVVTSLPTPPYTITVGVLCEVPSGTGEAANLILRNSSSGAYIAFVASYSGGLLISEDKWNSTSSFNSTYGFFQVSYWGTIIWLRIVDDATNFNFYISPDGKLWQLVNQKSRIDFITADQFGLGLSTNNGGTTQGNGSIHAWFVSLDVTTP